MSDTGQEKAMEERRERRRQGADLEVLFRIVSGETGRKTKEIPGTVKNLSETGFCLLTDLTVIEDLHVLASSSGIAKNRLELTITLSNQEKVRVDGVACWYNLSEAGAPYRYRVGVQIKAVSEGNLSLLRKFLARERKKRFLKGFPGTDWLARLFKGPA